MPLFALIYYHLCKISTHINECKYFFPHDILEKTLNNVYDSGDHPHPAAGVIYNTVYHDKTFSPAGVIYNTVQHGKTLSPAGVIYNTVQHGKTLSPAGVIYNIVQHGKRLTPADEAVGAAVSALCTRKLLSECW